MDKVTVGIVLFNPDEKRFSKCLAALLNQINEVIIFDNSIYLSQNIKSIINSYSNRIHYLSEGHNTGIAHALNKIMEYADSKGFDWVVTMDQDTVVPSDIIASYKAHMSYEKRIGIICPQIIDKRRPYLKIKEEPALENVDMAITSASCTNINAWKTVGKFDEWLFIDMVDNEFSKRLICSNFKILQINTVIVDQEYGNIKLKSPQKQKFYLSLSKLLHCTNVAKLSYKKQVNPMRVYYTSRNIIYINKKLVNYGKVGYSSFNCNGYLGFIISYLIPSFVRSQKKLDTLKAIYHGSSEGMRKQVKPWKANYS